MSKLHDDYKAIIIKLREMVREDGNNGTAMLLIFAQVSLDLDDPQKMADALLPAAIPFINESCKNRGVNANVSLSDPEWPEHFD